MNSASNGSAPVRPVIGVCARTAPVTLHGGTLAVSLTLQTHVDLLAAAGAVPVLLPLLPGVENALGRLDGLLLPGGPDVDPARYGAAPHPRTRGVSPAMDAAELALIDGALDAGVPLLASCRGMQLLNVRCGGTLHQHLPELVGHDGHQPEAEVFTLGRQRVDLAAGSRIAGIFPDGAPEVPCHHHQAVDRVGDGLVATAWAEDGVVETIEAVDHPFAVGVQWEVDQDGDERPYRALVAAARRSSPRTVSPASSPA
jgi:putative glutamine amidotransferase